LNTTLYFPKVLGRAEEYEFSKLVDQALRRAVINGHAIAGGFISKFLGVKIHLDLRMQEQILDPEARAREVLTTLCLPRGYWLDPQPQYRKDYCVFYIHAGSHYEFS